MSTTRRLLRASLGLLALCNLGIAGCQSDVGEERDEAGAEEPAGHDVVTLDSTAVRIGGIVLAPVAAIESTVLPATGTITYDANRVSHMGPRTEGRIVRLTADIGQRVARGQVLALLESPGVGEVRAQEREAQALVGIARENFEREGRLEQQGISSRKELLTAEADLRRAEAALNGARERLRVLGAGDGGGGQYALTAPFAGVVVARDASLGEMASPADQLFTVADLSRLWIELDVYERDLARVARGQQVEISTAAYVGRSFPGTIVYVGDVLDPTTRTVRARVEIPNGDGALRPGMFATGRIQVGGGGAALPVAPQGAVQEVEGRAVVFVPGERPGEFRAVPVVVGEPVSGGRVTIVSGLAPGDQVVVAGAFALRSELSSGEIGEHGH